jgi:hypothetical protein
VLRAAYAPGNIGSPAARPPRGIRHQLDEVDL